MHTNLIRLFRQFGNVSEKDAAILRRNFRFMCMKKKQRFDNNGINHIIFVNRGILRAFTQDESEGRIVTRIIAWENRFINNFVKFQNFSQINEII